jgi:hypothetical protein
MDNPGQTEPLRRMETAFVIIHKERTPRIKSNQPLAGGPIFRPHLQIAHLERIDDPVHVTMQTGLGRFHFDS